MTLLKSMPRGLLFIGLFMALTLTLALRTARAEPGASSFSREEIYASLVDYYRYFGPTDADPAAPMLPDALTEADKREWADATADMIYILPVEDYNQLMSDLATDYVESHPHRLALEMLFSLTRTKLLPYLQEQREIHPLTTVLGGVLTAFTFAEGYGFIKGGGRAWRAARGAGTMRRSAIFRRVISGGIRGMRPTTRSALAVAGLGTAAGITHAIYESLETRKIDPNVILMGAQQRAVRELGERVVVWRDELRQLTEAQIRQETDRHGRRMDEIIALSQQATRERTHLHGVAGAQRPNLQPVEMDLIEVGRKLDRLMPIAENLGYTSTAPTDVAPMPQLP